MTENNNQGDAFGAESEPQAKTARDTVNEMVDAGLLDDLMGRVDAGDLRLTGEGGFLPEMIKAVLERGLQAELTDHLGYEKGARATDHRPTPTPHPHAQQKPHSTPQPPTPQRTGPNRQRNDCGSNS